MDIYYYLDTLSNGENIMALNTEQDINTFLETVLKQPVPIQHFKILSTAFSNNNQPCHAEIVNIFEHQLTLRVDTTCMLLPVPDETLEQAIYAAARQTTFDTIGLICQKPMWGIEVFINVIYHFTNDDGLKRGDFYIRLLKSFADYKLYYTSLNKDRIIHLEVANNHKVEEKYIPRISENA